MDSLPFPQPITYISKIEINSTDKNASGFYDQLNQDNADVKNFLEWREKEHVDELRESYSFTEMLDVKSTTLILIIKQIRQDVPSTLSSLVKLT